MPFQSVGHTRLMGLSCLSALLWTTTGAIPATVLAQSVDPPAMPATASQQIAQQPAPQRKRPQPVRIRDGWLVTQRGAARRSCGEPMELVTAAPINRPSMDTGSDEVKQAQTAPSAKPLPAGFEIYVPYAPQALLELQFSIQTQDYEELHREVLALKPDSDRIFVTIPPALLEQPEKPNYRWFLEAKVQCFSPATSDPAVASDTEIPEETDSTPLGRESTDFSADFYSLPLESSVPDAETSVLGGWIKHQPTEQ